jgi:hypothetical protein
MKEFQVLYQGIATRTASHYARNDVGGNYYYDIASLVAIVSRLAIPSSETQSFITKRNLVSLLGV